MKWELASSKYYNREIDNTMYNQKKISNNLFVYDRRRLTYIKFNKIEENVSVEGQIE